MGRQLTKAHREAFAKWQKSSQSKDAPTVDINHWLSLARRMKILSTFPRLSTLAATAELTLTADENVKRGWVKNMAGRLYELAQIDSPFQRYVEDICSPLHCTKLAKMREVINREWEKDEKAVWFTIEPTNALILYWVGLD